MRFYRFDVNEIINEEAPFLDLEVDPKANWALNHLDFFPVEVNKAPYASLLRVPGIGVRGAKLIMQARKTHVLRESELRKLGIAFKRARFFITCQGKYQGGTIPFERQSLRAQLAAPIDGGRHGRRAAKVATGQMSLFDMAPTQKLAGQPALNRQSTLANDKRAFRTADRSYSSEQDLGWRALAAAS